MSEAVVPDLIEPLVGYRSWMIGSLDLPRLRSMHGGRFWAPGKAFQAGCLAGHAAPDPQCSCGVYALKQPLSRMGASLHGRGFIVTGRVLLWGRVLEATRGYRAEYAYPLDLFELRHLQPDEPFASPGFVRQLCAAYGIGSRKLVRRAGRVPPRPPAAPDFVELVVQRGWSPDTAVRRVCLEREFAADTGVDLYGYLFREIALSFALLQCQSPRRANMPLTARGRYALEIAGEICDEQRLRHYLVEARQPLQARLVDDPLGLPVDPAYTLGHRAREEAR